MQITMKQWAADVLAVPRKKAVPVLSFPCVQLLGVTVRDLIYDSGLQAKGMKLVADRCDTGAAVSMMDLSVEAEAFGASIHVADDEVPTVVGALLEGPEDAEALKVPAVGAGRTGTYIDAIEKVCKLITDRPVIAGVIGPFSLAGRLMGMSELMINCYEEPEMVETTLEKATEFITAYIKGFKAVGAHGVCIAEPAAGLLSPGLIGEFAVPYLQRIISAVQDDNFMVLLHNCGNSVAKALPQWYECGAAAYHFGNAVDMKEIMAGSPSDVLVMGNVDPAGQFRNGTPETVRARTLEVMGDCCGYPNFVISSGCDIPPASSWENIDAFFAAVDEFYAK